MPCLYCDKPIFCRRVCSAHYQAARRAGTLDSLLKQKVGRPTGRRDSRARTTWHADAVIAYQRGINVQTIAVRYGVTRSHVGDVLRAAGLSLAKRDTFDWSEE